MDTDGSLPEGQEAAPKGPPDSQDVTRCSDEHMVRRTIPPSPASRPVGAFHSMTAVTQHAAQPQLSDSVSAHMAAGQLQQAVSSQWPALAPKLTLVFASLACDLQEENEEGGGSAGGSFGCSDQAAYESVRSFCLARPTVAFVDLLASFYELSEEQLGKVLDGLCMEGLLQVRGNSTGLGRGGGSVGVVGVCVRMRAWWARKAFAAAKVLGGVRQSGTECLVASCSFLAPCQRALIGSWDTEALI